MLPSSTVFKLEIRLTLLANTYVQTHTVLVVLFRLRFQIVCILQYKSMESSRRYGKTSFAFFSFLNSGCPYTMDHIQGRRRVILSRKSLPMNTLGENVCYRSESVRRPIR